MQSTPTAREPWASTLNELAARADIVRVGKKRTNPGRLAVYGDAWRTARLNWRPILIGWSVAAIFTVAVWLLPYGDFGKGLHAGLLLAFVVVWPLMVVWVGGGLMARLEGTWAEEWTAGDLDRAHHVLQRIPSLRLETTDIDHVVITRSAVLAVEVKRRARPSPNQLRADVYCAAAAARTLRHLLTTTASGSELGDVKVLPVLVNWGESTKNDAATSVATSPGSVVVVVGGRRLREWIDQQKPGAIGPDYAVELAAELEAVACQRDALQWQGGRIMRHISRVR